MASNTAKRTKIAKPSIDRISNLSENLHSKILSLLPTKEAVKTSVLSTKWRTRWTSITKLDFNNAFTGNGKVVSVQSLNLKKIMFTQFVNRVFILLNPPQIQNFRLILDENFSDIFYLNLWICAAISRSVKDLELILNLEKPMKLPLTHFYSKTLTFLKLQGNIHLKLQASTPICFPTLLILQLRNITFEIPSNSSISFPNLEFLGLLSVKCVNEDSADQLHDLVIHRENPKNIPCLIICRSSSSRILLRFDQSAKLWVDDTLRLQNQNLQHIANHEYLIAENDFTSLLKADVEVNFDFDVEKMGFYAKVHCTRVFQLIETIPKLKFLSLLGDTLKAIRSLPRSILPALQNIVRLESKNNLCLDWQVVIKTLLHSMDNLEHLVMKGRKCNGSHESWWTEPLKVPKCLQSRVRYISFTNMNDCQDELELVKFFLEKGNVLKLLKITSDLTSDENFKVAKKVSTFPRGSPTCQVTFI